VCGGGYCFIAVCLSVYLFVCLFDTMITRKATDFMKFGKQVDRGPRNSSLNCSKLRVVAWDWVNAPAASIDVEDLNN